MSRRHMLSRRRLLRSASAITAARNRADAAGSKEKAPVATKAPDLTAPVSGTDEAETSIERINDLETVVDAGRFRDATT